jgi:hypothetical protein
VIRLLVLIAAFVGVSSANARVAYRPAAMVEAPIERALANVRDDASLSEPQRQRLLGRLHLIGYAQGVAEAYRCPDGEWQSHQYAGCSDRAYRWRPNAPGTIDNRGASPELPPNADAPVGRTRSHLRAAQTHYGRAVALDGSDLRARLGYAYVLDELNDDEAARVQLRQIIRIGMTRLQDGRWRNFDDEAVLRETVEHLGDLARTREDRTSVARLRAVLGAIRDIEPITPIVVPLADASFAELTDTASSVAFDFSGVGDRRAQGWLRPDAAWLVWDPNQRGDVRSGFDLIGQRTWAVFWSDGFEAMRSLDDNGDGDLTGAELGGLALWRDANVNGVSEAGEVRPVSEHGVIGLAVRGERERADLLTAPGGVRFADGTRRPLYDWTPGLGREPTS